MKTKKNKKKKPHIAKDEGGKEGAFSGYQKVASNATVKHATR